MITGPLRFGSHWSAEVHGLHMRFVRAAGRTLAIVGESEDDVRAVLRSFATSVAAAPPATPGGFRNVPAQG